ncbi:hypothetical protein C1H46_014962 [Malus baccata]|uniref:Malectin-like domain-containing protein n=1 Tax=Malus baccata TaxID=106549 RepID=A0A540MMG3_MALBA|nr:hypothetical protein C1H46_014962 [Malus baccata]
MALLLVLLFSILASPTFILSASSPPFTPQDNFLIDCGATNKATLPDGRAFKTESESTQQLKADDDNKVSVDKADVPSPLYLTARIFKSDATYTFHMARPGWHWIRLHFYPLSNSMFDLQKATFNVMTQKYTLLHSFNVNENKNNTKNQIFMKEYLLNITEQQFSIKFSPMKNSAAFINAIEVVSAPDNLITDTANNLQPASQFQGLSKFGYETMYRLNMGGPLVTSTNDTLGRSWLPDDAYIKSKNMAKATSIGTSTIKYPDGLTPQIAPPTIYATAVQMADAVVSNQNFNITWNFQAENAFAYLIRLHFCDIVSKSLGNLYFNVYINGNMAISDLDLSHTVNGLAIPYYKDIVVNASLVSDGLSVQIGPSRMDNGAPNAILNGLEVMKLSNSVDSLDGEFGVDGKKVETGGGGPHRGAVAAVGFGLMFGAFVGLGAMVYKWRKRPQDWQKRNSFSSWLLPVHAADTSFMSSKTSSNMYNSTLGLGRYFTFQELQEATNNFDSMNLADWGMQWKRKGLLEKIIDPLLVGSINPESMKKFGEAAEKCLEEHGVDRPTMGDVLWNLEYALQLQEAFTQGKPEDESSSAVLPSTEVNAAATSPAAVAVLPPNTPTSASHPTTIPEGDEGSTNAHPIDDQSGTDILAQFSNLNGR